MSGGFPDPALGTRPPVAFLRRVLIRWRSDHPGSQDASDVGEIYTSEGGRSGGEIEMNRKPKKLPIHPSCPHKDCSIGRHKDGKRQHEYNLDLHDEIPAQDKQKMSGKPLYWCGYCDCIYSFESGRYHIFGINKGSSWTSLSRNP